MTQQPDRFPIMGSKVIRSIPWQMIKPHEQQAQRNHGQTLHRLAQRGGLDPTEAVWVMTGKPWHGTPKDDWHKDDGRLLMMVAEWRQRRQTTA